MEIESLYSSKGSFNVASYANDAVDAHIEAALAAPTVEESFEHWKAAQWDGTTGIAPKGDAPWVWIANVDHLFFRRNGLSVAEQKPQPHGHGWSVLNNVDQWSWER
jgi:peptide/nickel transport system substrate-binding protein